MNQISSVVRKSVATGDTSYTVAVQIGSTWIVNSASMVKEGSYWVLRGVEELARAQMELAGNCITSYKVEWFRNGSDQPSDTEGMVLYAPGVMSKPILLTADSLCNNYFLTHLKSGWAKKGAWYTLNYYCAESTGYTIVYTKGDGTTSTVTGTATVGSVDQLTLYGATGAVKAEVTMGSRTFTVYYLDMVESVQFRYRNPFNAIDMFYLPCSVTEEPSTDFEVASQGNVESRYDVEEQLEVKVKTAPLPALMYKRLLDLCRSRSIECQWSQSVYGSLQEVYLKDYKFIRSSDPNSTVVLEMTMVYSDKRKRSAINFE